MELSTYLNTYIDIINKTKGRSANNFSFSDGEIIATNNISLIFTPAYDLVVYVSDGKTNVGPRSLSVHVTGWFLLYHDAII